MPRPLITNENEFQTLLERVDQRLQEEGVPITARLWRAESMLAVELGESFVIPHAQRSPRDGCYSGDDLTIRVEEWFDERYGERQKVDFSPGQFVILLRGDTWLVRLQRLYGRWLIVTSGESSPDGLTTRRAVDGPSRLNCLDCVVDLPPALRDTLDHRETMWIASEFMRSLDVFHALETLRGSELVAQARADVDATVGYLLGPRRNPALAKWSALQTAEKMLKEYIQAKGKSYKRTHDLAVLSKEAGRAGLSAVPASAIQAVQCGPEVRYGGVHVTLGEAVVAHHTSLHISLHVARALGVPSLFRMPPTD